MLNFDICALDRILLAISLNVLKSCLRLTFMVINLFKDLLPGCATSMLDKSKVLGFCSILKYGSIQLNVFAGVYMRDQSLVAAYPKEFHREKSRRELTWSYKKVEAGARSIISCA